MDSTFPREGVRRSLHPLTSGNSPFHGFSNFSWTIQGKSLDTGKTVLILVNLPSCQWHVSSKRRYSSAKWQKFTDVSMVGVGRGACLCPPPPTIQTSLKFGDFWGAMSLFVVNKSLSNVTILLNALFPAESTDFLWLNRKKVGKKKKNVKRSIWIAWHVSLGQPGQRRYYTVVIFGGAWD